MNKKLIKAYVTPEVYKALKAQKIETGVPISQAVALSLAATLGKEG